MAKIYLSYNGKDKKIASEYSNILKKIGHSISMDIDNILPGEDWRRVLTQALKQSDGMILLVTEHTFDSTFVGSEIGMARAFFDNSPNKFLIPVIIKGNEVPSVISDLYCLFARDKSTELVVQQIDEAINKNIAKIAANEIENEKSRIVLTTRTSTFVDKSVEHLKQKEIYTRRWGNTWFIIGFLTLIAGLYFSYITFNQILKVEDIEIGTYIFLGAKSLIILGILISCSRYSFLLGKSFFAEVQKNSDREHAIKFGQLYMDIFGDQISSTEFKEVFKDWNVKVEKEEKNSNEDNKDEKSNLIDKILELVKSVKG